MRKGTTLTATEKMDRAREATKRLATRELWSGLIFARLWPAYITPTKPANNDYPLLLCIESPAGLLIYRVSEEEKVIVEDEDWLPTRPNAGEKAVDRTPLLIAIAGGGWPGAHS
jgi:hypothetical protein